MHKSTHTSCRYKAISFDAWETILSGNPVFSKKRKELFFTDLNCEKAKLQPTCFEEMFDNMKADTERQSEIIGKHIGFNQRILTLCAMLNLDSLSVRQLQELNKKHSKLALRYPPTLMHSDIVPLFKKIHDTKTKIIITSNTGLLSSTTVRDFFKTYKLDIYIDYSFYSDCSLLTKPNPVLFQAIAQQVGYNPESILHIGDNQVADFEGPKRAGFHAFCGKLDAAGIQKISSSIFVS